MKTLLLLSEKDNVLTCMEAVKKGEAAAAGGERLAAKDDIPVYHKMARVFIPANAEIYKYGEVIGAASCDISAGAHVHVHNVESMRGRGDKARRGTT